MTGWLKNFSSWVGGHSESVEALPEHYRLVDCRREDEYGEGHLQGAMLMPHDQVEALAAEQLSDLKEPVLLYCRSGHRSGLAADVLRRLGYQAVINLGGLTQAAERTGLPTVR